MTATTTVTDAQALAAFTTALDATICLLRDVTTPAAAGELAVALAEIEAVEQARTKSRTPAVRHVGAAVVALQQAAKGVIEPSRAVRNATGYLRDALATIGAGS